MKLEWLLSAHVPVYSIHVIVIFFNDYKSNKRFLKIIIYNIIMWQPLTLVSLLIVAQVPNTLDLGRYFTGSIP